MNLKLYIKQTDTFRATGGQIHYDVPSGKPYNPQNLDVFPGGLPGNRQWPNYGNYVDVTNDVSSLYKLKLTWTTERDGSGFVTPGALQQQKSASGTITFEGAAYQYLKKWLVDDVSAPLNSVDVKIEHTGCGDYFDYTIKSSDLRWCENSICTFDVTIKQKDEVLNCIKSTLVADNWQGWFNASVDANDPNAKRHPRFSYCNEQRPNGIMVMLWYFAVILMTISLFVIVPLVLVINSILAILHFIKKILSKLGFNTSRWNIPDIINGSDLKDTYAQFFVESAGCGREHPAPLIRDYIKNVCDKCGVKVDKDTAPIFFAQEWYIETSDANRGDNGVVFTSNPHYNACYFFPQTQRGIRRYSTLNLLSRKHNDTDFYLPDNSPMLTLDMFLDELKTIYNAEWRIKTVYKNGVYEPYLFFQRKDYFVDGAGNYIFDFTENGIDRSKLLQGICFEWNERQTPALCKGVYNTDAADTCGNEAMSQMNAYVSFGNSDTNPTFGGMMDKTTNYGATKFRLDGASSDYIFDAMQVVINASAPSGILWIGDVFRDMIYPGFRDYADYALLMKDETCTMPKILIWDGQSYDNAKCVKPYHAMGAWVEPACNPKFNKDVNGNLVAWSDEHMHKPKTYTAGTAINLNKFPDGFYTVNDWSPFAGKQITQQPAMLVNYPMYFEPGYYDTLWDWFHWIDDPRLKPVLNQNWTAKIDLCCDDLQANANGKRRLGVFDDASAIALGERVKLPFQFYPDGVITEIEVSYDPTDNLGQYIQLKGTV